MMRFAPMGLLLIAFGGATPLAAQAAPSDSAAIRTAQGKKLFEGKGLCSSCHGLQGEGVLGPTTRLAAGKSWIHVKGTQTDIATLIRQGVESEQSRSGTAMPARGGSRLTDLEVDLVAAYVMELHKRTPAL